MALNYKEVAEILKIIDASQCEEVVLELEGTRLVVRRSSAMAAPAPALSAPPTASTAAPQTSAAPSPAVSAPSINADAAGGITVRSPMVGTFYRQPSPDEPPFVEAGTHVSPGTPLCLIEVMKLYTTIEAMVAGTVTSVLAEDGKLVEFDQPLFAIEPDA